MKRFSTLLCVLTTLCLAATGLADGLGELHEKLKSHESYAAELTGTDGDGEFSALYFYSPEITVFRRKDRKGRVLFVYDEDKIADRVTVTRDGAKYRYALDNPRLPKAFPNSLVEFLLDAATGRPEVEETTSGSLERYGTLEDASVLFYLDGQGALEALGYTQEEGGVSHFKVTNIVFDPDPEHPDFGRIRRYIQKHAR